MSSDFKNQYLYIQKNIDFWKEELIKLQKQCIHENVYKRTFNTSTVYYIDCYCPDCGKKWNE